MANNRRKVQTYTPAARVENFLKGYAEGKNKRIELELKQQEAQKANVGAAKDMMLMGMMQKLGILPSVGGASTTQPSQGTQAQIANGSSQAIGPQSLTGNGQENVAKLKTFYEESIANGVPAEAFSDGLSTFGFKLSEGNKKRLQLSYQKALEESLRSGKVQTTEEIASAQKRGAGLAGETAGKLTMLQQASNDVKDLKNLMFDEKGNLKRLEVISSNLPFGGIGDTARKISSRMGNALSAKLRSETGAAATKEERAKIEDIFEVSGILDSSDTAKDKLDRLQDFMDNAIITTDPSNNFVYKTGDNELDVLLNLPADKLKRAKKAGFSNADIIRFFSGGE